MHKKKGLIMVSYEKWVAPSLLVFSTILKIGSIITLYSVYAHPNNMLHDKQKGAVLRASSKIGRSIKNNHHILNQL